MIINIRVLCTYLVNIFAVNIANSQRLENISTLLLNQPSVTIKCWLKLNFHMLTEMSVEWIWASEFQLSIHLYLLPINIRYDQFAVEKLTKKNFVLFFMFFIKLGNKIYKVSWHSNLNVIPFIHKYIFQLFSNPDST